MLPAIRMGMSQENDRRAFFRRTIGRLIDEASRRAGERVAPGGKIRPPGALPEIGFIAACTRCGACVDACPPKVIRLLPAGAGLAAHTPVLDPISAPCTVCPDMPCAQACPTEALSVPGDGWAGVKLGWIELVPERCVVFRGTSCGVCADACPVGERALKLDTRGQPIILQEGCVGCGACVKACVTTPASIVLHPGGRP